MRVDPKTKEVLDMWEFQVLKNWAYSRRTFVLVSVGEGRGNRGSGGKELGEQRNQGKRKRKGGGSEWGGGSRGTRGRCRIGLEELGALERMEDVGIWRVGTDQKLLHIHQ